MRKKPLNRIIPKVVRKP